MFRKLFVLCLIAVFGSLLVSAQTPEPRKDGDKDARVFSWSFDGGGSYLGVQAGEVTRENFAKLGLREVRGVVVEKVIDGSPAAAAGIQAGDVIVGFNGEAITSSRKLTRLLNEVSPDHIVKVTVVRGGAERDVTVTVGKRPMPKWDESSFNLKFSDNFPNVDIPNIPMPKIEVMPNIDVVPNLPNWNGDDFVWHIGGGRQIGVGIFPLTKQLAEHFGVENGLMISNVRENSPASKAGLKAGDIIVEVEGKVVKGDGDLVRAINEKKGGEVTLTIVRNGNRQTIKVTPEEMKGGFHFDGPFPPHAPDQMRLVRPPTPAPMPVPMPLNEFTFRGRII